MGPMPEHSSDIRYARVRDHEWLCDAPATYTAGRQDACQGMQIKACNCLVLYHPTAYRSQLILHNRPIKSSTSLSLECLLEPVFPN